MPNKIISLLFIIMLSSSPAFAAMSVSEKRQYEARVTNAFERIISLWKDEDYESLYGYGDQASREALPREEFIKRMKEGGGGLACCWETIQGMEVTVERPASAYVRARVGYEAPGSANSTRFADETFRMVYQNGEWRINLLKISPGKHGPKPGVKIRKQPR